MVYELQKKWQESLKNYELALKWKRQTGNDYELPSTYYHIGQVYQAQQKWKKALENFNISLEYHLKFNIKDNIDWTTNYIKDCLFHIDKESHPQLITQTQKLLEEAENL